MKNKNPLLILFILFVGVGAYAAGALRSNDVQFEPNDQSWKVSNVKAALDEIYNKVKISSCEDLKNNVWNFTYTGEVQSFIAPCEGVYKLEVWGAQGGTNSVANAKGGNGGYSSGYYTLSKKQDIYVYVGGQGKQASGTGSFYGGWNGGGGSLISSIEASNDGYNGTGGGSTDISLIYSDVVQNSSTLRYERSQESYNSRIIVAGGGGAGGNLYYKVVNGEVGGGTTGGGVRGGTQSGISTDYANYGILASASLGLGQSVDCARGIAACAPGGAGLYGGNAGRAQGSVANTKAAGGGSGYIGGVTSYNGISPVIKSGNEVIPTHDGTSTMTGNSGNGYAKITYIGE